MIDELVKTKLPRIESPVEAEYLKKLSMPQIGELVHSQFISDESIFVQLIVSSNFELILHEHSHTKSIVHVAVVILSMFSLRKKERLRCVNAAVND